MIAQRGRGRRRSGQQWQARDSGSRGRGRGSRQVPRLPEEESEESILLRQKAEMQVFFEYDTVAILDLLCFLLTLYLNSCLLYISIEEKSSKHISYHARIYINRKKKQFGIL